MTLEGAGITAPLVGSLLSTGKVLGFVPAPHKSKLDVTYLSSIPWEVEAGRLGVCGYPQLHREFRGRLVSRRPMPESKGTLCKQRLGDRGSRGRGRKFKLLFSRCPCFVLFCFVLLLNLGLTTWPPTPSVPTCASPVLIFYF